MNYFKLLSVFILSNNSNLLHSYVLNQSEENQKLLGFVNYGNWCGPGHGGYQDCCNNTICSDCNLKKGSPDAACLKQCPPIDMLDYHCALHDECCINNPKDIVCLPEGNKCYCDCSLIEGAKKVNDCIKYDCKIYRSSLISLFNYGLSCWYKNEKNISSCNKISMRDFHIKDFCSSGNEINPFD